MSPIRDCLMVYPIIETTVINCPGVPPPWVWKSETT